MADRLHFDDVTKITCPTGMLDASTWMRLTAWPYGREMWDGDKWCPYGDMIPSATSTIRGCPAPLEKPSIDWTHVAPQFIALAVDKSGNAYLYTAVPQCDGIALFSCDDGSVDYCRAHTHASYRPGTVPWDQSLILRPGVEA